MKIKTINKQQEELLAREAVEKGKIKLALEKSYVEPGRQQGRLLVQCEKKGYRAPPVVSLLVSSFFLFFIFSTTIFLLETISDIYLLIGTLGFFFSDYFSAVLRGDRKDSPTLSQRRSEAATWQDVPIASSSILWQGKTALFNI